MTWWVWLAIPVAGAAGAVARYSLSVWASQRLSSPFPWGTFLANVMGSLLLGVLLGAVWALDLSRELKMVLGGGFLGALTTYSTWMVETLKLVEKGAHRAAAANICLSLGVGIVAAGLGIMCWSWWS